MARLLHATPTFGTRAARSGRSWALWDTSVLPSWIAPQALVRGQIDHLALVLEACGLRAEIVETRLFPKEHDCHSCRTAELHVERTQELTSDRIGH